MNPHSEVGSLESVVDLTDIANQTPEFGFNTKTTTVIVSAPTSMRRKRRTGVGSGSGLSSRVDGPVSGFMVLELEGG